ncbi:adenosylcobinamide-GDP ribazoletransferase [Pyrococcus kukulkanii]|uniref:adenosylcobinamide-GDP ribazoletransferase n=1 Tax=Pyrococcus kukulkanii TaxID=1609559 RepID=UPI003564036B
MRNLTPFLTRIPIKGDFEKAREEVWAFPLVAVITSLLPTLILYLKLPMGNLLAVLALYFTIGLLHLDGLADWADGIMVKGDRERKIKAMKDVNTGIAGIFAVVVVLLVQVYSLERAPFYSLYLGELNSKYAMLLALATKRPLGKGLGAYFMEGMNRRSMVVGTALYIILVILILVSYPRATVSLLGLVLGAYAIHISLKNFGGLNGDCIGAVAEITRAGTLLIMTIVQ